MEDYERTFFEGLATEENQANLVLEIIKKRFAGLGITLKPEQLENIRKKLKESDRTNLKIELDADQAPQYSDSQDVSINLSEDQQMVDEVAQRYIARAIDERAQLLSEELHDRWQKYKRQILSDERSIGVKHQKEVEKIWGVAIESLEHFVNLSTDAGFHVNVNLNKKAVGVSDVFLNVIRGLHARGCQVAREIVVLIKAGYADGAQARWRTLHELSVISTFIFEHGNDAAQLYWESEPIAQLKEAKALRKGAELVGNQQQLEQDIEKLESDVKTLRKKHGDAYVKSDYGWAAKWLSLNGRPSFYDIEKLVNFDNIRHQYLDANLNVHASIRGDTLRLGLPPSWNESLLVGPSVFGINTPGAWAAYSLGVLTANVLRLTPGFIEMAGIKSLTKILAETHMEFARAAERLQTK